MKKIICNNKLKKICTTLILFMLLFNFVFPSLVLAGLEDVKIEDGPFLSGTYIATGSIQDIFSSANTTGNGSIATLRLSEHLSEDEKKHIEKSVKEEIKQKMKENGFEEADCSPDTLDRIYRYYKDAVDVIKVKVKFAPLKVVGTTQIPSSINVEEVTVNIEKIDLNTVLAAKDIPNVDTEAYKIDENGNKIPVNVDENGNYTGEDGANDDWANLGGILLSPLFYLINFVADAILSNVGNVMTGDGLSLISGIGILTSNIPENNYSNTYQMDVKTDDFTVAGALGLSKEVSFQYPNIKYSPEEIFAGKIDLLSIDFISGKNYEGNSNESKSWLSIRKVISQWYQVLRMVAIIGLLSVLIYTGIKIIISANAKDKAKYKEWVINWLIAVAILFSMHYIMAFIVAVTGEISKLLGQSFQGIRVVPSTGGSPFTTNLIGLVRFMIQSENFYIKVGYEVMYIALIVYTIKFTFVYLKRVLNMAFLTLIAPIVALTYPIDKINDGKAQGFEMWLKEYIFNAILQPMHFILYYILVGSAVSIAASNPLYGIAVLAFLSEGERLLKRIFGFDKAGGGTVGGIAGAFATGAIASKVVDFARFSKLGSGNAGKGGSGSGSSSLDKAPGIKKFDIEQFGGHDNLGIAGGTDAAAGIAAAATATAATEAMNRGQSRRVGNLARPNKARTTTASTQISTPSTNTSSSSSASSTSSSSQSSPSKVSNKDRMIKGFKAVGKKAFKPVWDFDHTAGYNGKRLGKNALRAIGGAALGTAAAAVQAGISITDGKYSPLEGVAAVTAGYAGAGAIGSGIGNLIDTYNEGTIEGDKKATVERIKAGWRDREDVIAHNRSNYKPEEMDKVLRIEEDLIPYGFNLNEMKSVIKYGKKLEEKGMSEKDAYKYAANALMLEQDVKKRGASSDIAYSADKQKKFIDTMIKDISDPNERKRMENLYSNGFAAIRQLHDANK